MFGKYDVGTVAYIADIALQYCIFWREKNMFGNIIVAAVVGTVAYTAHKYRLKFLGNIMLEQWHILQILHCNIAYFAKRFLKI